MPIHNFTLSRTRLAYDLILNAVPGRRSPPICEGKMYTQPSTNIGGAPRLLFALRYRHSSRVNRALLSMTRDRRSRVDILMSWVFMFLDQLFYIELPVHLHSATLPGPQRCMMLIRAVRVVASKGCIYLEATCQFKPRISFKRHRV